MTTLQQGWAVVAEFTSESEAQIARGMLDSAGIPAVLQGDTLASVYPMTMTWAPVKLLVPGEMASKARLLLNTHAPS